MDKWEAINLPLLLGGVTCFVRNLSNESLNNVVNPGIYRAYTNDLGTITDTPSTFGYGYLEVITAGTNLIVQRYTNVRDSAHRHYERFLDNGSWSVWIQI